MTREHRSSNLSYNGEENRRASALEIDGTRARQREENVNRRKSNICCEQIRTQMARRESFSLLLIYHAHLTEWFAVSMPVSELPSSEDH